MIKNPRTRRQVSMGLFAAAALLFLLAPENAWISLVFAGLGILLEIFGVRMAHSDSDTP